jgi:transcriptional antiterminator NusG
MDESDDSKEVTSDDSESTSEDSEAKEQKEIKKESATPAAEESVPEPSEAAKPEPKPESKPEPAATQESIEKPETTEDSEAKEQEEVKKDSETPAIQESVPEQQPEADKPEPEPEPATTQESIEKQETTEDSSTENVEAEPSPESEPVSEPDQKSDTFLELDADTQQRMQDLEEAERLAEEEGVEPEEIGIFAVKTSIGHEKMVANWLAQRVRKRKASVYAILSPPKLRGYLLLEGIKNKEALQDLIKGVQHARSVVDGATSLEEIEHFLTPKPLVSGIEEGDVVEIIAGPFKGEKAKVTQIDESKEEITVELFEAMVSIPVTIRGDHVRILEKEAK